MRGTQKSSLKTNQEGKIKVRYTKVRSVKSAARKTVKGKKRRLSRNPMEGGRGVSDQQGNEKKPHDRGRGVTKEKALVRKARVNDRAKKTCTCRWPAGGREQSLKVKKKLTRGSSAGGGHAFEGSLNVKRKIPRKALGTLSRIEQKRQVAVQAKGRTRHGTSYFGARLMARERELCTRKFGKGSV